jgi:hypothetical protein
VPGDSPTPVLRAVEAGEPNAVVLVPPNGELVDPLPNGFEVVDPPKAGLGAEPNSPPPVFVPAPKGDEVVPVDDPNPPPPKADVPAVAVPPPNRLLPVVVVAPNAGLAAPKALFVVLLPKAPKYLPC